MNKCKNYGKTLVIAITLVTCLDIYAKKLVMLSCDRFTDAESCSQNCSPLLYGSPFGAVDFEINEKSSMVFVKIYEKGSLSHSFVKENCKIFNKENWDCSESIFIPKGPWTVFLINKMADGIWTQGQYTSKETKFTSILGGVCAK